MFAPLVLPIPKDQRQTLQPTMSLASSIGFHDVPASDDTLEWARKTSYCCQLKTKKSKKKCFFPLSIASDLELLVMTKNKRKCWEILRNVWKVKWCLESYV